MHLDFSRFKRSEDDFLDRDKWIRRLPPQLKEIWMDDPVNREILRQIRKRERWLYFYKVLTWTGVAAYSVATPLALMFGGPLVLSAIALRALVAAVTLVPIYLSISLPEPWLKEKNAHAWSMLASRVMNRVNELARGRHHLEHADLKGVTDVDMRAYDDLANSTFGLARAARGLAETRVNAGASTLFAAILFPFSIPVIFWYLRREAKAQRAALAEADGQASKANSLVTSYRKAADRVATIEGIESARFANLQDAAEALLARQADPIPGQSMEEARARSRVERLAHELSIKLCAVLMWASTAFGIGPSQTQVAVAAITMRATAINLESTHRKTVDDYVALARSVTPTLELVTRERMPTKVDNRPTSSINLYSAVIKHGDINSYSTSICLHKGALNLIAGRNGSGKSSILLALRGAQNLVKGRASYFYKDEATKEWIDQNVLLATTKSRPNLPEMRLRWGVTDVQLAESMVRVGLDPDIARDVVSGRRDPSELSDGQYTRVVMGPRLLLCPQQIVLLDEPLAKLDPFAQAQFISVAKDVAHKSNKVVVITTNSPVGISQADRLVLLAKRSRVIGEGPPAEVLMPEHTPPWAWPYFESGHEEVRAIVERLSGEDMKELKRQWYKRAKFDPDSSEPVIAPRDAAKLFAKFALVPPTFPTINNIREPASRYGYDQNPTMNAFEYRMKPEMLELVKAYADTLPAPVPRKPMFIFQ